MLVEMRTYVLHAGKMAAFLDAMEREGLAIERPILGRLQGYYSTEIGTLTLRSAPGQGATFSLALPLVRR